MSRRRIESISHFRFVFVEQLSEALDLFVKSGVTNHEVRDDKIACALTASSISAALAVLKLALTHDDTAPGSDEKSAPGTSKTFLSLAFS
jgi:hypothetical protein